MTEPASHTLAYLRRLDEELDRLSSEVGGRFDGIEGRLDRVDGRLGRIEDELLVLNGIVLRLKGREVERRPGSRPSSIGTSAGLPSSDAVSLTKQE
jgi:hypothetical protein